MAKDRLAEVFAYLRRQTPLHTLPRVGEREILEFERLVRGNDRTNAGAVLSLDWSWHNSRPSEELRHAIRAYLLVSIYSNDIAVVAAGLEAVRVKQQAAPWFNGKIAKRLARVLGLSDPVNIEAIDFGLAAAGGGVQRARPTCGRMGVPVEQIMRGLDEAAIVLIDMQSGGDIGQHRYYGDRTVLEYQQSIIALAAELNWVIYDIVIDQEDAAVWGNAYRLADKPATEKRVIVERQRRPSYAEAAKTKTIGILSHLFAGARVRHIPKPTHPAFAGTLFAEHLEADGITTVIVTGYDANQCVKATVFGVPETTQDVADREPSKKDIDDIMELVRREGITGQAATKRIVPSRPVTEPYERGLLDRGLQVITSRCILASGYAPLDDEWALLSGRR